uniref:B30.2/SPRY domain-containing protein n=1 Tax=Amphiprion percula TaxID=161767 RepID=A0A3P8RMZ6_AMPPE
MSLQVCHCGWSKVTTYHGLRTHQGKKGCTPKGMSIPQSAQFSYIPRFTYLGSSIKLNEPVFDIFSPSVRPDATEPLSDMSLQNLRIQQGEMGGALNGMRIPESEQYPWRRNQWEGSHQDDSRPLTGTTAREENTFLSPNLITQMDPAVRKAAVIEIFKSFVDNQQHPIEMDDNLDKTHRALDFPTNTQPVLMPALQSVTTSMSPAAKDTKVEANKSLVENQQHSLQMDANSDKTHRPLEFSTSAQPVLMPFSQTITTQMNSAATKTPMKETNKFFFETPQSSHQTTTSSSNKARRALDFSTGAQQVEKLWEVATSIGQETFNQSKEKEKEKEAQKLLKARQDMMRADLQQKIHTREHKMADVRSSVTAYKGSLDAEWLEINSVFSEVMKVVEDARQKALQPLEQRRREAKREAQDLIQKLQREIDMLKKTIDELDTKPDLQVSPLTGLKESWKNVSVDTSFSFGTLRTTTSVMIKQIQEKLENLSSIELKRIPAFAVDVKLDPTTAHQCLILSADGKKVTDGGQKPKVPDTPERFDAFGSILGLDGFTSGKSYWEVEVTNKTGWDLGVARGSANRKGKLTLKPDNGYWVTVHYEDKKYAALATPPVSLSLKGKAEKVGVFVDYEEGLVSFYDVTTQSHIYSFTECSFSEPIFPYFSPHLQQNGKNIDPLIISAVQKQQ